MRKFRQKKKEMKEEAVKPTYRVFITEDTLRGMLLEVKRHPGLESFVQMAGCRKDNDFFFDMVADSGINAKYSPGQVEKDHKYCDHLSFMHCQYYDYEAQQGQLTVSQVHKHPVGCQRFSMGDKIPNTYLSKQFHGVVCGLILVDPSFRLNFWYIDEDGNETEAVWIVDNEAVHTAMPRKNIEILKSMVEQQELPHQPVIRRRENNEEGSSKHILWDMPRRNRGGENGLYEASGSRKALHPSPSQGVSG